MPQPVSLRRINGPWASLLAIILVVVVLWAAKTVLIPVALGVILAFVLTPLVRLFDRMRLPRFVGVALTMSVALSTVGGVGYVLVDQFSQLSAEVSEYTYAMRLKVAQLRAADDDDALAQLTRTVDEVAEQLDENAEELERAQVVRVLPERSPPVERLRGTLTSVFEPVVSAFIVIVLVCFMLGQREDLRDRFIRLIGPESVTMTTRLMDEAAHRVSRFIVAQLLMNICFGALVTAGLYWIGVPYAALWGGFTAVLRFVPYVGTLLSTISPALLAFAVFPGWVETLQTLALFITLDLLAAYFVEPVVFGQRTGVSSFALLISALFWIWVWGPIGLLLATPLTVCIAVLGRHVRSLRFLAVILADEPALTPYVRFYQRLLARDEDEASVLIDQKLEELGPIGVMDQVIAPAMALVVQHRSKEEITADDARMVLEFSSEIVEQICPLDPLPETGPVVVGLAARAAADQVLLEMLQAALPGRRVLAVPAELSAEEAVRRAVDMKPAVICITAISPACGSQVRNFCRRLRSEAPEARILVLRPTLPETTLTRSADRIREAGADDVASTVKQATETIENFLAQSHDAASSAPRAAMA